MSRRASKPSVPTPSIDEHTKAKVQSTADIVATMWQQPVKLRPWSELFRNAQFDVPSDQRKALDRLEHHTRLFFWNYATLCLVAAGLYCFVVPFHAIPILIAVGMTAASIATRNAGTVSVGIAQIDGQTRARIALAASSLLMLVTGAVFGLVWAISVPLIACTAHAILKRRKASEKVRNFAQKVEQDVRQATKQRESAH